MNTSVLRSEPYKRILLKLSGEMLQNRSKSLSIDPEVLSRVAKEVKETVEQGIEVAIVIGGGNIFRGANGEHNGIDRSSGDYMGMLGTVINALAVQNAIEKTGIETRVQTAFSMRQVAEPFIQRRAVRHLEKGRVVIFGGGTGNPYFSTDTAAALRASEIGAHALLKATKVDGIYSANPTTDSTAVRYERLTYHEAIARSLKVMDTAAFSLCMENRIPIIVFDFPGDRHIARAAIGEAVGTLVTDSV